MRRSLALLVFVAVVAACATLRDIVMLPRFEAAPGRGAELRLLAPSVQRPLGGAAVRLWARVENPNGFGLRLETLAGELYLEGQRAALVDLPLGLPLRALQDTVVPIDLSLSFSDLPGLADVATRALGARVLSYRLDGRVGVDAGAFGPLELGPTRLLDGEIAVLR